MGCQPSRLPDAAAENMLQNASLQRQPASDKDREAAQARTCARGSLGPPPAATLQSVLSVRAAAATALATSEPSEWIDSSTCAGARMHPSTGTLAYPTLSCLPILRGCGAAAPTAPRMLHARPCSALR